MGAEMSETKFTPAPWVLEPTPSGLAVEVFSGDDFICRTRIKDGALIAAAPDLYAALERVLSEMQEMAARSDLISDDEALAMNEARAALARARGET